MESLAILLDGCPGRLPDAAERERLAEEKNRLYRQYLKGLTPADVGDGTRQTLACLRERGYRLAVGSSSKNARLILEAAGLTDAFDAIADGTDITRSKPDPEVFLCAAKRLATLPAFAPPMPSIWRRSGEPKALRITLSRSLGSCGRSSSRKNTALLVPPRI